MTDRPNQQTDMRVYNEVTLQINTLSNANSVVRRKVRYEYEKRFVSLMRSTTLCHAGQSQSILSE